jgi:cell division protein ZapA
MEPKSIRVRIYGTEYPLRGENEELTRQAASYVDSLMNQFHERNPEQSPSIIAVLTALNIAEELIKNKKLNQATIDEVESEIKLTIEKISTCLDNT